MAEEWEYTSAEAGSFKLDRLLAAGWEVVTVIEETSVTPLDDPWPTAAPPAVIQLRRLTGGHK